MLKNRLIPAFGRCETFYPKFFHFSKLVWSLEKNPDLFSDQEALVRLGMSNSQLKSLKHWGQVFKLINEEGQLTVWGRKLFSKNGFDPYLEETVTIMHLHDALLETPCLAPTWYFTFNSFRQLRFTEEDLVEAVEKWALIVFPNIFIGRSLIKKDVRCLLKMYTESIPENPFKELNLITLSGKYYEFRRSA